MANPTVRLDPVKDVLLIRKLSDGSNLGAGKDHHLFVGRRSYGEHIGRFALKFADADYSGLKIKRIERATFKGEISEDHTALGATPRFWFYRSTEGWPEGDWGGQGGGDWADETWSNSNDSVYPGPSTTAVDATDTGNITQTAGQKTQIDILKHIRRWAPTNVQVAVGDGTYLWGLGEVNYGLAAIGYDEANTGRTIQIDSREGDVEWFVELEYTTNTAPSKPSLALTPSGRFAGTSPLYSGDYTDPDAGQTCAFVQVIVATSATVDADGKLTTGIFYDSGLVAPTSYSSTTRRWTKSHSGSAYPRGTNYYRGFRVKDSGSPAETSPWSTPVLIRANRLPTVTKTRPTASALAYIHNLGTDPTVWTSGGSHAKPRFEWTFADLDGGVQKAYRVKVYDAASAGTMVNDSGKVTSALGRHDSTLAMAQGLERWWTIEVWDDLDESSGESSRTAFKVGRFGQAIYEYQPTGGASSSAWAFTSASPVAGTQHGFLFATATGAAGAGRSAWNAAIGSLDPNTYLNVMARVATYTAGTSPALADMTFSWVGSGVQPDRWTTQVATPSDWQLDKSVRRYGTQSYKCTVSTTSGNRYVFPWRSVAGDDVVVVPNTTYLFSAFVKTQSPLASGAELRLAIYPAGSLGTPLAIGTVAEGGATTDTATYPEGWQRLILEYTTTPGQTRLRPMVHYLHNGTTSGDKFWADATKLEEGTVATAWSPGFVADAVVMDANGIAIDAQAGGILRLRSGDGSLVQLGAKGLTFGTDVPLFHAGLTRYLYIGDDTAGGVTTVEIAGGTVAGDGGKVTLQGGGADAYVALQNEDAKFKVYSAGIDVQASSGVPNILLGALRLQRAASGFLEIDNGSGNAIVLQIVGAGSPGIRLRSTDGLTPYIDFSNDSAASYDGRIILVGDDELEVQGAKLDAVGGLEKAGSEVLAYSDIRVKRVAAGTISGGSAADVTVTWPTAFADTNYTVALALIEDAAPIAECNVELRTVAAGSCVVRVYNGATNSRSPTIHALAVHD